MLRESDPQPSLWEALLPAELKRLPAELEAIEAYLDDERFIAPFRALFDRRLGCPSVPVDTLLWLLYLKHHYQLGLRESVPGGRRFDRLAGRGSSIGRMGTSSLAVTAAYGRGWQAASWRGHDKGGP